MIPMEEEEKERGSGGEETGEGVRIADVEKTEAEAAPVAEPTVIPSASEPLDWAAEVEDEAKQTTEGQ